MKSLYANTKSKEGKITYSSFLKNKANHAVSATSKQNFTRAISFVVFLLESHLRDEGGLWKTKEQN